MKLSINLLQQSQKLRSRLKRLGLILQTVSLAVMAFIGVVVFILLSYTLLLSSRYQGIIEDIDESKEAIKSMMSVESKQFLIKQKLTAIARILDEYQLRYDLISDFYEFAQQNITITGVSMSRQSNKIEFKAKTADIFSLARFLIEVEDFSKSNNISKVIASGFSRNAEGEYSFGMDLEL